MEPSYRFGRGQNARKDMPSRIIRTVRGRTNYGLTFRHRRTVLEASRILSQRYRGVPGDRLKASPAVWTFRNVSLLQHSSPFSFVPPSPLPVYSPVLLPQPSSADRNLTSRPSASPNSPRVLIFSFVHAPRAFFDNRPLIIDHLSLIDVRGWGV